MQSGKGLRFVEKRLTNEDENLLDSDRIPRSIEKDLASTPPTFPIHLHLDEKIPSNQMVSIGAAESYSHTSLQRCH